MTVRTNKLVDLGQLDREMGGHGCLTSHTYERDGTVVTDIQIVGDWFGEDGLRAALETHVPPDVEPSPTPAQKLAALNLTPDDLKEVLGLT